MYSLTVNQSPLTKEKKQKNNAFDSQESYSLPENT